MSTRARATRHGNRLLMLLTPLPALALGVLIMQRSGVNPAIWKQQLAAGLTLMILCAGLIVVRHPSLATPATRAIAGSAALLLLAFTLIHPGAEGVRRWDSVHARWRDPVTTLPPRRG